MGKQEFKSKQIQVQSPDANGNHLEQTLTVDDNFLPSPADLQRYQEIDPTIISFLITASKKEQEFRHKHESAKLKVFDNIGKRDFRLDFSGMMFAAIVMLAGLVFSAWLIYCDKIVAGTAFGGGTIIVAAIAFIRRAKPDDAEHANAKKRK